MDRQSATSCIDHRFQRSLFSSVANRHAVISSFLIIALLGICFPSAGISESIQEKIDAIFARPELAGNEWTGYAIDESGNIVHYINLPDTPRIPASNTKIPLTSAAYELLGPEYSFQSRVYANGPIVNGVLQGDMGLVVEHDPTWSGRFFGNPREPLDHIARQIRDVAGVTSITGMIRVYGASIYDHTNSTNLTQSTQATRNSQSAAALREALIENGVAVGSGSNGNTGFNPPGALIYTHESSDLGGWDLGMIIRPVNKSSISPSCDMIIRHIGYKLNGDDPASDTYAAGRVHVEQWMADKPFDSTGHVQADGSGQSYNNRLTARIMVGLFRYMHENHPDYEPSYTIACTDGTLTSRICGEDSAGRVHGKTGTLLVTTSLSGYVRNRHINERVYFSFIHNNLGGINQAATRQAVDDAARVLAGEDIPVFRPPGRPNLYSLRTAGNPTNMVLQWFPAADTTTYRVYRSVDGGPFVLHAQVNPPLAQFIDPIADASIYAYRVVGHNNDGEGIASSALAGRANTFGQKILLVRGTAETSPTSEAPMPSAMNAFLGALPEEFGFEMAPAARISSGSVSLSNFSATLWFFEHEAPETHLLGSSERIIIQAHLQGGGAMMFSGSKLASNLDPAFKGDGETGQFLHDILKHEAVLLDPDVSFLSAQSGGLFQGLTASSMGGCDVASLPVDVIEPLGGARRELVFQPGSVGGACLSYEGDYRLLVFPASFSCLLPTDRRSQYMERIMTFLLPPVAESADMLTIY